MGAAQRRRRKKMKKIFEPRRFAISSPFFLAVSIALLSMSPPAHLQEIKADEALLLPSQTFIVTNTNGSGAGSFRQAILDANTNAGLDAINFNIPGGGVQSIFNTTAFANLTDPVIIDATTQPGYAGIPLIELDAAGSSTTAFNITAGGSTIKGIRFANYGGASTNFVVMLGGGNNILTACTFGVNDSSHSSTAILIDASNNNRVGGSTAAERNYIAQNRRVLIRNGATGNRVIGNWFGADTNGTPLARTVGYGVRIESASDNFVGGSIGTTPGGACTGECNSIAGTNNGVEIAGSTSSGNKVSGNMIGLLADGMTVNANATYGVRITDAPNNTVGGTTVGERNVLTGSPQGGVRIENATASGNIVSGNYIGVKTDGVSTGGSTAVTQGVSVINGVTNTRIGGLTTGERNVISGNNSSGVAIATGSTNNSVIGNYIGTNASGTVGSTTRGSGVSIVSSNNNFIGSLQGTTRGGPCTGGCNVISGNGVDGTNSGVFVLLSSGNVIDGNFIGLNAAGNAAIVNGRTPDGSLFTGSAVELASASGNIIGRQIAGVPVLRSPEQVPMTMFCIYNRAQDTYTNIDTATGTLFAEHCQSRRTLTAAGDVTNISDFYSFESRELNLVSNASATWNTLTLKGSADLSFPVSIGDPKRLEVNFTGGEVIFGSCTCGPQGIQTIVGTIELGGGGGSNDNIVAHQYIDRTPDEQPLDSGGPLAPIYIETGDRNKIYPLTYTDNYPAIQLEHGTDNYWGVNSTIMEHLQDDLSNAIAIAAGDNGNIPTPLLSIEGIGPNGDTVRATVTLNGAQPGARYKFVLVGTIPGTGPNGERVEKDFTLDESLIPIVTAPQNGNIVFTQDYQGGAAFYLGSGKNFLKVIATKVETQMGPYGDAPLVDVPGSSSRMSLPALLPGASVSGRVVTPAGLGLRNAVVSLTDAYTGIRRIATTSTFGFYSFANVTLGRGYIVAVSSRRYRYAPQQKRIYSHLPNLDFVGME